MASKSREAQEKLVGLEKDSALFEKCLDEAAKFVSIELQDIAESKFETSKTVSKKSGYYGREEWLLRWLLKKLQTPKDGGARKSPLSWRLFAHLLRTIPVHNAAKILNEKKFMVILQHTLEETHEAETSRNSVDNKTNGSSDENSLDETIPLKISRKRKRSGDFVASGGRQCGLQDWLDSVLAAVSCIIRYIKPVSVLQNEDPNSPFSAEYMKTVIRTTAEESAKILGRWLFLCRLCLNRRQSSDLTDFQSWLASFIEIWEVHSAGNEDHMQFSLHCLGSLLSLVQTLKKQENPVDEWEAELEQLIARNIIIPAKTATSDDTDPKLLNTLTRVSVLQNPANATVLFDVAIRSIQPHGSRRRRPQDAAWLETVFSTLKEAMPPRKSKEQNEAIRCMLQLAIDHKVDLDLQILRGITVTYAFQEDNTDWNILATIIRLDSNVFLIPSREKDLLSEVLQRVTNASLEPTWPDFRSAVLPGTVISLMKGFAKARDLSGFIRHWYSQLVEFERLRKEARLFSMNFYGAWEDDALQTELRNLLEVSLTIQQIEETFEWLALQVVQNPDAVCVILEAIAGSISQEHVVDAVGSRLYHILFDNGNAEKLDDRHKWRSWRILSQSLHWMTALKLDEIANLWKQRAKPFDEFAHWIQAGTLIEVSGGDTISLEVLAALRCACAAWTAATGGSRLEAMAKPVVIGLLEYLASDIGRFPQELQSDQELGQERCGLELNTLYRGIGWSLWAYTQCIFVEYPEVLCLASELPTGMFRELLKNLIWIASASGSKTTSNGLNEWLIINPDAFPDIWLSALSIDQILNNSSFIDQLVDVLLCSETYDNIPFRDPSACDIFTIQMLLHLPLEIFTRRHRERIMQRWSIQTECNSSIVSPPVLSLKIKILQRLTFYEGMKFQDLLALEPLIRDAKHLDQHLIISLLKELVRLTVSHMTTNLDQPRNRDYISEAVKELHKQISDHHDKEHYHPASMSIFEPLLAILIAKSKVLDDQDITSNTELSRLLGVYKASLLYQLESIFQKAEHAPVSPIKPSQEETLCLNTVMEALISLAVTKHDLGELLSDAKSYLGYIEEQFTADHSIKDFALNLRTFLSKFRPSGADIDSEMLVKGSTATVIGRQSVMERTKALVVGSSQQEKLKLLKTLLGGEPTQSLDLNKLLATRHIVLACEDFKDSDPQGYEEDLYGFSTVYSELCSSLWKVTSLRKFCLISEILDIMLKTKPRSISQWNMDTTLSSITLICSSHGPSISPSHRGPIYLHLCTLLRTILLSHWHRLKLQGHFHLLLQTMQQLLRCLFLPLPHSSLKSKAAFASPPPWLSPSHPLTAIHASAFTKLVTSICDPTISSVSRPAHHGSQRNSRDSLTSATEKAKKIAGQHMKFLLTTYVRGQLEMRMLPEVREKLVPGLYAIFDTTSVEMRRGLGEGLDASGRAVLGGLVRDWLRFGKWDGS